MKEVSIHVGQRIRLYRKTKNLTIETFAGMIHKSKATVSKYENGDISIDDCAGVRGARQPAD
mgnify:CR=1 FL=1